MRRSCSSPASTSSGQILGSLTLVVFAIPTAMRAWIEDVVVDESARGAESVRRSTGGHWSEPEPQGPRPWT